jgi:hypothetical protein
MAAIEAVRNICNGFVGMPALNYVCLDAKMMIPSALEAEILKNPYFGRPFRKNGRD